MSSTEIEQGKLLLVSSLMRLGGPTCLGLGTGTGLSHVAGGFLPPDHQP